MFKATCFVYKLETQKETAANSLSIRNMDFPSLARCKTVEMLIKEISVGVKDDVTSRDTQPPWEIAGNLVAVPSRFHFGLLLPFVIYSRCDECVTSRMEDSLRHSRSRINAYRALASPSLIALSSKDPILTAFELSWELRRLSFLEHEFKIEYQARN